MELYRQIKLGDNIYYIKCDCCYKKKNNFTELCLSKYQNDYYDGGDLSLLIKEIENKYNKELVKRYDGEAWFLADALFIYDNIPFISGISDYYTDSENRISSLGYISKEELDEYIKDNNIKMKDQTKFELVNQSTWNVQ